jgi:hypothetical protein
MNTGEHQQMNDSVKPNLLIIGAMKASTTLLYNMLGQHPQIWFPAEKEPHYFTSPDYGRPGAYQAYLKLFAQRPAGKAFVGEASTGYSKIPYDGPTPKRIHETLGRPKMIYILRDPVQRTISNFQHSFAHGYYGAGYRISQAVVEDPIIIGASLYARQLSEYETEFGACSVLVLIADELHRQPARVLGEVERFLGANSFDGWNRPVKEVNSASAVKQAVILNRILGESTFLRQVGRYVPSLIKSAIVGIAPKPPQATPITPIDEDSIFNLVADDLKKLHERLGDRIECWPSVRKLRAAAGQHTPALDAH